MSRRRHPGGVKVKSNRRTGHLGIGMWDQDVLEYGYVLHRTSEGGWWHGHFGRSAISYRCELLGRQTSVVLLLQHFGPGGAALSRQFLLTLDGEGLDLPVEDLRLDFRWGNDPQDTKLTAEAKHFQQEVMPLLHGNSQFQHSIAEVVHRQRYTRVARTSGSEQT